MSTQLARASRRHLARHPWQLALTAVGVALGVAVVVAVELANASAQRAFELSMATVRGPATHRIVGGPSGLDERLYTRLRVEAGVRASAPVVEGYAAAGARTLHVLGVDPFAEPGFRGHLLDVRDAGVRRLLTEPDTVAVADVTAERMGLAVGDAFAVTAGGRRHTLRLAARIPTDASDRAALDGLLVSDIATAQALADRLGRLSHVDLILPEGQTGAALRERIEALLPSGARIVPAAARERAMSEMTRAFRTNLTAMGLLALLVGLFLIYNTMTFAVVQRRGLIARLRLLGATPAQVFTAVIGESLLVALVGTAAGLAAGVVLADALLGLVTRTINDLYFVLTVNELRVTSAPLIKGVMLGLGGTALAAVPPAAEAARVPPRAALARSILESRVRRIAPRLAWIGGGLAAAGLIALAVPTRDLVVGFAAQFLIILGVTLATPCALDVLARGLARPARRVLGVQGGLALRGVSASLSRTGVAVSALTLAVATTVGVAVMIDSFRSTVEAWLHQTLQADVFVSAPGRGARTPPALEPRIVESVRALDEVAAVATGRHVEVASAGGLTTVFAVDLPEGITPRWRLKRGDPDRVWRAFRDGRGVLVSEPYAYRHDVQPGEHVTVRSARGESTFEVAGVYYDYGSSQGEILVPRRLYARHFDDPGVSGLGVHLAPGASLEAAMARIRQAAQGAQLVTVTSNRDLRRASLAVFDRTFTITHVLRLLAVIVAVIGIVAALMALALERSKELAVLRAMGFTPGQLAGLVSGQSAFLGLAAGAFAIPVGLVLALLLIHVINKRAFGWSMQTLVGPEVLLQALALGAGAALLAGLYPAWRAARAVPAQALREE